jgi:acetylornithine deacetylase/succinyl-diaminopimelate desuccinylase-like protein
MTVDAAKAATPMAELDDVLQHVDTAELCELALQLTAIPSPTGEEGALGEFVADWFRRQGMVGFGQEVAPGRVNGVGLIRGRGDGPNLMFNGHLDTGAPVRHEELSGRIAPLLPMAIPEPYLEDGILYGTGMDNMQSGLAAIMAAARAIHDSGVRLRGDLIVAGVVGEVSRAPVDQYQGPQFQSKGIGTRYLLTHGVVSDYAIVADTSHFGLAWAQCGVVYAKITVPGHPAYTPFTRRAEDPKDSPNAVVKMALLISEFESWAARYEQANAYHYAGGSIEPKASIGAIAGGAPFKVANSPIACSLYVDVRTPPGKRPAEVQRELRSMLDASGLDYELELYTSQVGYEAEGAEPVIDAVRAGYDAVVGEPVPEIDPVENSMWTDTNLYNEVGIPAVKFGIGAALIPSEQAELHGKVRVPHSTFVTDLVTATKVYAAAALRLCGVS